MTPIWEIREKRGLCYSIFAQAGAYSDTGMTTIYAGTGGGDIAELVNVTVDELKRSVSELTEAEVSRARAQMKAGLLMGLESPSNRAERLAHLLHMHGRIVPIDETIARVDDVTVQKVQDYASHLIDRDTMAMAVYGPAEAAPSLEELKAKLVA